MRDYRHLLTTRWVFVVFLLYGSGLFQHLHEMACHTHGADGEHRQDDSSDRCAICQAISTAKAAIPAFLPTTVTTAARPERRVVVLSFRAVSVPDHAITVRGPPVGR